MIRNDYLHTSSRFRRVPSFFEKWRWLRAPEPQLHTGLGCACTCRQEYIHIHVFTTQKEVKKKKEGRKRGEKRQCQLVLPGPKADLGGAFGSGLAVPAAKPSSLEATLPPLPRPQAPVLSVWGGRELVLAGYYRDRGHWQDANTWWWPAPASEVAGKRGCRRQVWRGAWRALGLPGLPQTSAKERCPLSPPGSRALQSSCWHFLRCWPGQHEASGRAHRPNRSYYFGSQSCEMQQ